MKKKFFSVFALVLATMLLFATPLTTAAQTAQATDEIVVSRTVEQLEDGYYAEVIITEKPVNARATTYTKSGSKNYVLRNANGDELLRFVLHGTFSVTTGVNATCTSATYTSTITNTSWSLESASTSRISNRAMGTAKYIRKVLLITVETKIFDGVLSCDANGNLS